MQLDFAKNKTFIENLCEVKPGYQNFFIGSRESLHNNKLEQIFLATFSAYLNRSIFL